VDVYEGFKKGGEGDLTKKNEVAKKECLKCKGLKRFKEDFYLSNSPNHADGKYPVCKQCIRKSLKLESPLSQEGIDSIKNVLLEMNRPFIYSLYESSVEESGRTSRELFGMYLKNIILNHKDWNWTDSEFESLQPAIVKNHDAEVIDNPNVKIVDDRSKDDVLRLLGYDPFEYEAQEDKNQLYNSLVDMLDESTLEDGFKLQASIEIVKGFNQIDKINRAISNITSDVSKLATNSGGIKSLIDSKKNILASLIKLAEENGISVKHNNQKSKGAGTLSGIIKTLQEKGFEEGEVNLFDVETALGIRQVADLSNQSIVAQLQFDENDYTAMLMEQREIIQELDNKVMKLEEENRLLKKEIIKHRKIESDTDE
jgi:hypothetical protein